MEKGTQLLLSNAFGKAKNLTNLLNIQFITTYKTKIFTRLGQGGNNNSVTMPKVNRVQKDEKGVRLHWKKMGKKL
jgi:hypothetical protein